MPRDASLIVDREVDDVSFPGHGWAEEIVLGCSDSSKRVFRAMWHAYLVWLARRGRNAVTATSRDVSEYLGQYRPRTAARRVRFLHKIYTAALGQGNVGNDPTQGSRLLIEREPRSPAVTFEAQGPKELIARLPAADDWEEHRDQAIAVLALAAGPRFHELRVMQAEDIRLLSSGLVQVSIGARWPEKREEERKVKQEGAKPKRGPMPRDVVLDESASEFIRGWLGRRSGLEFAGPELFPARKGGQMAPATLDRRIRRLLGVVTGREDARSGVGVLRSTFGAQRLAVQGLGGAQRALGHNNILSTLAFSMALRNKSNPG